MFRAQSGRPALRTTWTYPDGHVLCTYDLRERARILDKMLGALNDQELRCLSALIGEKLHRSAQK